jgi:hypothetical protein
MYLQTQGIFLYTEANKEVRRNHETTWNKKLQQWTGAKRRSAVKRLCVVMGEESIGKFYNNNIEHLHTKYSFNCPWRSQEDAVNRKNR